MVYTKLSPEEIKARVYEETKKQFLLQGIRNTDVKQIAQTVGIGRTTLYRYYPSREQLAFMVSLELTEIFLQSSIGEKIEPSLNGYEKYRMFFEYFIDNIMEHPEILTYFSEFDRMFEKEYPDFPEAKEYDSRMNENIHAMACYMEAGQKDGSIVQTEDAMTYTLMIVNAVFGLAQRIVTRNMHYLNGEIDSALMLKKLAHTLVEAVKA